MTKVLMRLPIAPNKASTVAALRIMSIGNMAIIPLNYAIAEITGICDPVTSDLFDWYLFLFFDFGHFSVPVQFKGKHPFLAMGMDLIFQNILRQ